LVADPTGVGVTDVVLVVLAPVEVELVGVVPVVGFLVAVFPASAIGWRGAVAVSVPLT
jgi:hypothetical protein